MFMLGLGLGMIVSSAGGAIVLYLENRRGKQQPEPTHYHITLDEDANLPDFFREQLLKKPIDWTKSFPQEELKTEIPKVDKKPKNSRLTKKGEQHE